MGLARARSIRMPPARRHGTFDDALAPHPPITDQSTSVSKPRSSPPINYLAHRWHGAAGRFSIDPDADLDDERSPRVRGRGGVRRGLWSHRAFAQHWVSARREPEVVGRR